MSNPDARLRFTYAASDPAAVVVTTGANGEKSYQPAPGGLRLWCSKFSAATHFRLSYRESRDPRSVTTGGDYLPPGEWVDVAAIKASHDDAVMLYCESVAPSAQMYDQTVTVEVDEDGDGPEPAYIATKHFFTSIGTFLEGVQNGVIGARDRRMRPSLPNPTIDLQNVSVTNARVADDGSGLLVDVAFSGTVHSAVCDLTQGEETGTIQQAYASVNDEPLPQSVVSLQVTKGDTPAGQDRPYPYQGTFNHTLTGVKVTEGQNTLGLIVSDPLYHLSGTAEVAFEIEATPPGALGEGTGSEVLLELPVAGSTLAADEARLSITVDDEALVTDRVLKRQAGGLLYRSTDGQAAFQFTQAPNLTTTAPEALHGYVTLPQSGWQGAAFSPLTETDAASGVFTWSAAEAYSGYWGWSVSVGQVSESVESGPGEMHAYTVRLQGPQALLAQVRQIHIAGQALPVVMQNGVFRVADAEHPDRPVTLAGLPLNAVQPPEVPQDQSISQELAALDIGTEWEDLDVPEEEHDAMEGAMSRRLAQNASATNGLGFTERLKRQAKTALNDGLSPGFYGGFMVGFLDNPWSNAKDCCSTLIGIGKAAAKAAWLVSPMGMMWEFTFGDCYAGEIKAATNTCKKAADAVGAAYDFAKKWGGPVCDFLEKLMKQSGAEVEKALHGEIPERESMGPELQVALEVVTHLIMLADDAWVALPTPYERGYWLGYIAFEVAAVVVAGVLTAPAGGAGGAALLARHGPKVTRIMGYLEKLLTKFDDVPGIKKLVDKIKDFISIGNKLGDFCFVAGTLVLTSRGEIPIEQIKENDWVWSRDEHTGEWGWRPVVKTFITHPQTLVHLRYAAQGGAADADAVAKLGQAQQGVTAVEAGTTAEIACTRNHLIHARRKTGGMLATLFLAAGMLQAGDLLTLADGRDAAVQDLRVEQAVPGTTFTTYNFTVADHHTYFAGELPVWVHNKGALIKATDDCGFLGERLNDIVKKKGDDPSKYFEYLKEARGAISGTVRSDRIWGNGYKKMTQKMVKAFEDGDITDVDKIPTYNQLKASFAGSSNARKLKQADTDIHHIVPKSVVEVLRDMGALDPDHSLGDVAAVALSKADHRKISDVMNPFLKSDAFTGLKTPAAKARAIVDWYRRNGYTGQQKVAEAWFRKRGII